MNLPTFVEATMVSCQPKCGEGFLVRFTQPSPLSSSAPVAGWLDSWLAFILGCHPTFAFSWRLLPQLVCWYVT
jgi:hypothetical protein